MWNSVSVYHCSVSNAIVKPTKVRQSSRYGLLVVQVCGPVGAAAPILRPLKTCCNRSQINPRQKRCILSSGPMGRTAMAADAMLERQDTSPPGMLVRSAKLRKRAPAHSHFRAPTPQLIADDTRDSIYTTGPTNIQPKWYVDAFHKRFLVVIGLRGFAASR